MPGKTPHPTRETDGHSFGQPEPHVEHFDPDNWIDCSAFLFGVDLFNAGFFWESHEQWEAVWHSVGRTGVLGDFLKGLIKLSAAGVKSLEGRPVGVRRHLDRAVELFSSVSQQHGLLCGLAPDDLVRLAREAKGELPPTVNSTGDGPTSESSEIQDLGLQIKLHLQRPKPS